MNLPKSTQYPPIFTPDVDTKPVPKAGSSDREAEQKSIVERLRSIPEKSFQIGEQEMDRLSAYYDAVTEIFGIDIRSIARTRMHMSSTIMMSSFVLVEDPFDRDQTKKEGQTFFESRLTVQDAVFRANGTLNPSGKPDGYKTTFSVGAVTIHDEQGSFEVDFPVYSLPRDFFAGVLALHKQKYGNDNLAESPFIRNANELMSRRVHDWIHAAILYDTQSLTDTFQQWGEDIFFVEHIIDDAGMINYELLASHVQYKVWQHIFMKDPTGETKKSVISEAKQYLEDLEELLAFIKITQPNNNSAEELIEHLTYVGMRGVFDIISYNDIDLLKALGGFQFFHRCIQLMPEKSTRTLSTIYQINELPFGKREQQILPIDNIISEYIRGLKVEADKYRDLHIMTALLNDRPENNETPLNKEYELLPEALKSQLITTGEDGEKKFSVNITQIDPRIFRIFNKSLAELKESVPANVYSVLISRIEIDKQGHFYFKVDRDEVDLSKAKTVVQQKGALLIQAQEPIDLTVIRTRNLTSKQEGAKERVMPGEVMVLNTPNEALAQNLLRQATDNGNVDIPLLLKLAKRSAAKGFVELDDIYPNDIKKVIEVYEITSSTSQEGAIIIQPGYYQTKPNKRRAVYAGAISMNSTKEDADRRRILEGAIVENHVQLPGEIDIFPVDAKSFNRTYKPVQFQKLPQLKLNENFFKKTPIEGPKEKFDKSLYILLRLLANINEIRVNGFRGKPQAIVV